MLPGELIPMQISEQISIATVKWERLERKDGKMGKKSLFNVHECSSVHVEQ